MIDPATQVRIRPTANPSASVLEVQGDVTSGSEKVLTETWDSAVGDGARTLILDFSRLEYMNSGGIGLLVMLLVRAQRQGLRLQAIGLADHYRQIFELTRLDEVIGIHDREEEALAATAGDRR